MPHKNSHLSEIRDQLDHIDRQIIDLLRQRNALAHEVLETKIKYKLPIFVAKREDEKVESYRKLAAERGLDPSWAEDFLRMMMTSSRDSQSIDRFPCSTKHARKIVIVGGGGGMGKLYKRYLEGSLHRVEVLEKEGWENAETRLSDADLVLITVPIATTVSVIKQIAPLLNGKSILADFTSNKHEPVETMLESYSGPVLGLHPMHGPDVKNLSKQLMIVCEGRDLEASGWLIRQFELWGLRTKIVDAENHDKAMNLVQGLRHFVALVHGSFMQKTLESPADMLNYSSPIYRAELMMTGRIFAQDAELYADIVFANPERRKILLDFFDHQNSLRTMVENNDRVAFVKEFEKIAEFFGEFAEQALEESSYIINRLADRFAG